MHVVKISHTNIVQWVLFIGLSIALQSACASVQTETLERESWSRQVFEPTTTGWAYYGLDGVFIINQLDSSVEIERIHPANGSTQWTTLFQNRENLVTLLQNENSLFAFTFEQITAFEPNNGSEKWTFISPDIIEDVFLAGEYVGISTQESFVVLDSNNGQTLSTIALGENLLQQSPILAFTTYGYRAFVVLLEEPTEVVVYRIDRGIPQRIWSHFIQQNSEIWIEEDQIFGAFSHLGISGFSLISGEEITTQIFLSSGTRIETSMLQSTIVEGSLVRMLEISRREFNQNDPLWTSYLLVSELPETTIYFDQIHAIFLNTSNTWALLDASNGELLWQTSPEFNIHGVEECEIIGADLFSVFATCTTFSEVFLVAIAIDSFQEH